MLNFKTPSEDEKIWTVTGEFADGRMIEQSYMCRYLKDAEITYKRQYPDAYKVRGEFVMPMVEYVRP